SATIIVRIKNGGDNAYRQSEYGESIIVERHFSRSGSSGFKLKNARGRIVSTKKSDLDDITDFYVLQIDNPMNVLSQDLARQFLSTSSPTEKYKFFVKGVQLEQLDQDYRLMEESVNQNAVKLNVYREELKIAEAELEKARKKQKLLDKHDKLNQRRHETRKILVWAIVQNQEMRCEKISRTIEKISAKMEETEDEIQRLEQALTTTEQKEEEAQQEHAGAIAALESHQSERSEIQERLREAKNERHAQQGDNRSIREHIKELEATIERTKDSIAEERRRLEELDNGKSNVLQNEIEEKQGEAAELKRKSEELRATLRPLQQEAEDAQRNAESKRQPVSAQQSEIEQAEYRLQSLKRNKDQQRTGFPPQLPALLNAIKAEQSSFSKPPVGPLGNHIRLLKPKWSFVLEQTFGGVLSSFIVRSKRDMNTLQGIMRRVRW
ncbi:Structural maintenance of chromosomes protein 6, partial [Ascosphaera atra]